MDRQQLAAWRPSLYHVMRQGDKEQVRNQGLRSPEQLLQDATVNGSVKWRWQGDIDWQQATPQALCRMLRLKSMQIKLSDDQIAVLRDQHALGGPNGLRALQRRLNGGLGAEDWLVILNARVFMFPCHGPNDCTMCEAGNVFRNAYPGDQLAVLKLQSARIPESLLAKIQVSRINGGAINGMAFRGPDTYVAFADYRVAEAPAIREITISGMATVEELLECSESSWFNNNR